MLIRDFLMATKTKLDHGVKNNDFSIWLEQTLISEYENFEVENQVLNEQLNWNIPDICEQMEPGMESDKFHKELSDEVNRLFLLLNEK